MRSQRSRRVRADRVRLPEVWAYDAAPGQISELTRSAPARVARLAHGRPLTLLLCLTPETPPSVATTAWGTGAGTGTGRDPGWHIGLGPFEVRFAVEQSGGTAPSRRTVSVHHPVTPHVPLCIVARWGTRSIQVSANGHHSIVQPVEGYGGLETNDEAMIGGLRDFSDEFLCPGIYHRTAIYDGSLTDKQVGLLTMNELAALR